jgi:uncharacterized damage-inducible protein DinB
MLPEQEYLRIISIRYSLALSRIIHAVYQLDDQQLWLRPSATSNSIGIIIQHVSGNLHQWICSAIGGEPFQRHRAQEFEDAEHESKKDILDSVETLVKKIQDIVSHISPESLLSSRRIQGFDETVMSALIAALTHLELHAGQIMLITKLMLEEKYQEYWRPANTEQGK